jgi:molecular chaperone GrpE
MGDTKQTVEQTGDCAAPSPEDAARRAGKADAARRGVSAEGSRAADGETAGTRPAHDGTRPAHDDASKIEGDLDELVATAAQRDEYLALAQRTQADFENYRKRVARESTAAQERGVAKLAKELLPALDNLDRALEEAGSAARPDGAPDSQDDPLLAGVRLVRSELSAALARVGIESFSPVGEPFDPAVHEAMATTEQPPAGAKSGTVVEVYQPGYRLGTTIIRPARVVVAA